MKHMGRNTLIHFAHANGFPSPCYRPLFSALQQKLENRCQISFVDRFAHTAQFKVSDSWPELVDELLLSIRSQNDRPVVGIGHSLGGVLTALAAMKQPQLFRAVIMLDAPLLAPHRALAVNLAKCFDLMDRITPAGQTKDRRSRWRSRREAFEYFRSRRLFADFSDAAVDAFLDGGLEASVITDNDDVSNSSNDIDDSNNNSSIGSSSSGSGGSGGSGDGGLQLRFDAAVEYSIYRSLPHRFDQYGPLTVPTALLYGSKTHLLAAADRRHMLRHFNIAATATDGGHLFPLEHPQQTATLIAKQIADWNTNSSSIS